MSQWKDICKIDDILPETGVCALLGDEQVAIFRPYHSDQVFAISNIDPFFESSVLSRGLIAEHQWRAVGRQSAEKAAFSLKRRLVHGRRTVFRQALRRASERRRGTAARLIF